MQDADPRPRLAEALLCDLGAVCAELLDRYALGDAPRPSVAHAADAPARGAPARGAPLDAPQDAPRGLARPVGRAGPSGPLGLALRAAAALTRHLPLALDELALDPIGGEEFAVHQALPRRAWPSRAAADYAGTAGTACASLAPALPRAWWTWAPAGRPPREAVAWLLSVVDGVRARLDEHVAGLDDAIEEALAFRHGPSAHGRADVQRIEGFARELRRADASLAALRARLVDSGGHGLIASRRMPEPFPRGASWGTLRALASGFAFGLGDARAAAALLARELVERGDSELDLAYLYQRWCGWRLVEGLAALGWRARTDPLPALLLSGAIEFERAAPPAVLELLCEPRLASRKPPVRGITAPVGELTPDFVLLTRGPHGLDAHVLDPTCSLSAEHRRTKRKYLRLIQIEGVRTVAGVRVVAGPLRSWAAAPLPGTRCVLDSEDWRGAHGTIPMNPLEYHPGPLLDWLRELDG